VAFLKFSRDRRGYENYYLFDGKGRPRLLFWFRTPPQVKVGRAPFSDDVRKMVEAQNPGVSFDWPRIIATPVPPPDADHWRERRRLEKAAKRAARAAEAAEVAEGSDAAEGDGEVAAAGAVETAGEEALAGEETPPAAAEAAEAESPVAASDVQGIQPPGQRRRRRRRRGRRGGGEPSATTPVTAASDAEPPPQAEQAEPRSEPETPSNDEV